MLHLGLHHHFLGHCLLSLGGHSAEGVGEVPMAQVVVAEAELVHAPSLCLEGCWSCLVAGVGLGVAYRADHLDET